MREGKVQERKREGFKIIQKAQEGLKEDVTLPPSTALPSFEFKSLLLLSVYYVLTFFTWYQCGAALNLFEIGQDINL